jgi:hypothetical protein
MKGISRAFTERSHNNLAPMCWDIENNTLKCGTVTCWAQQSLRIEFSSFPDFSPKSRERLSLSSLPKEMQLSLNHPLLHSTGISAS